MRQTWHVTLYVRHITDLLLQSSLFVEQRGKPAEDELSAWGQVHSFSHCHQRYFLYHVTEWRAAHGRRRPP
jgi:hypothetical protein